MKTKITTLLFIAMVGVFASCKKAEKGAVGPAGANGTNGAQGNANVKIYNYGSQTLTATSISVNFTPVGLTAQKIDSSLIVVYYSESAGQWNLANGLGPGGQYATIQYSDPMDASINVYLQNANGTNYSGATVVWQKVRIVVVPTGYVFRHATINYNNYDEVASYYNIKD